VIFLDFTFFKALSYLIIFILFPQIGFPTPPVENIFLVTKLYRGEEDYCNCYVPYHVT